MKIIKLLGGQTVYIVEYNWQKTYGVGATFVDEKGLVLLPNHN